jgi:hypothetical protein
METSDMARGRIGFRAMIVAWGQGARNVVGRAVGAAPVAIDRIASNVKTITTPAPKAVFEFW